MASKKEYLDFVLEQLSGLVGISYRAMMGEYLLYYNDKLFGGIYDDRFLVKVTASSLELLPDAPQEIPYDGAKPMLLVTEIENKNYLRELILAIYEDLSETKKKSKKKDKIMAFDFKKEFKEFYMPKNKPEIVTVPKANYIAVRGKGNPNEEGGEYKQAVGILYAIAYTLKMSYKSDYKIEGFFEYVVPPLEGFWWQDGVDGCDYRIKAEFNWISVIRLPDFVTKKDFDWAVETASRKKKMDCSRAEFLVIDEGLCVQIMHHGPFDDEPATVAIMDKYLEDHGYRNDFTNGRLHHEIYMSDARKVAPEKWKTVIRHPICKKEG